MTQQELADLAGVSRSTVSRLERGEGDWKPSTLDRLATALQVTPEELMGVPVQREIFASTAERRIEAIAAILRLEDRELERVHPLLMDLLALAEDVEEDASPPARARRDDDSRSA